MILNRNENQYLHLFCYRVTKIHHLGVAKKNLFLLLLDALVFLAI